MAAPNGTVWSSFHTRCWNAVPGGASGTSNDRRSPAKYSFTCRAIGSPRVESKVASIGGGSFLYARKSSRTRAPASSTAQKISPNGEGNRKPCTICLYDYRYTEHDPC